MKRFLNWLRNKLSVPTLCPVHHQIEGIYCPACVAYARGWNDARQIRYDEIERYRNRRKKRARKVVEGK